MLLLFLGLSLPSFVRGLSAALLVGCLGCCVLFGSGVPPGGVWFVKTDLLGGPPRLGGRRGGSLPPGCVWVCCCFGSVGGVGWEKGGAFGFAGGALGLALCSWAWRRVRAVEGIPLNDEEGIGFQVVQGWCLCNGEEPGVGGVEGC